MAKLKVSGGTSTDNSVKFFLTNKTERIEAIRQADGSIVVRECNNKFNNNYLKFVIIVLITALFRKTVLWLHLPQLIYHFPTVYWAIQIMRVLIATAKNKELCMYHGAEHKVFQWYKKGMKDDITNIKKYSRINRHCSNNILGTFLTFQILSSLCFIFFDYAVPELITCFLPLFLYEIIPFNALGLLFQLFTTKNPTEQHIAVALKALETLLQKQTEDQNDIDQLLEDINECFRNGQKE